MRTTKAHLENAVQIYAKLTGKNYILRHRDSRVGGYGVCIVYPERGYSQSSDIICGKASEVYNELWAAIRAIEEYQQVQAEKPQFLIRVSDGMVCGVYTTARKPFSYLLIDEDAIGISAQDDENWWEELRQMSSEEIIRRGITAGFENDTFLADTSAIYPCCIASGMSVFRRKVPVSSLGPRTCATCSRGGALG